MHILYSKYPKNDHNPGCSKSREALALTEQFTTRHKLPLEVVEYLKTPPTPEKLALLHQQLGCSARDMLRSNEQEYSNLDLTLADNTRLFHAISTHPQLLQRPIVVYRERAMIGRPPACLNDLLQVEVD